MADKKLVNFLFKVANEGGYEPKTTSDAHDQSVELAPEHREFLNSLSHVVSSAVSSFNSTHGGSADGTCHVRCLAVTGVNFEVNSDPVPPAAPKV